MQDTKKKISAKQEPAASHANQQSTTGQNNSQPVQNEALRDTKWNFYTLNALLLVSMAALVTRFYRLDRPSEIAFDEVHFGKFASYYLRRENYFDVHPPVAKMMFAAVGYMFGYDGSFKFEKIGMKYLETAAPYVDMRGLTATCGSLVIILSYLMFIEMKFPLPIALLGTCMIIFDNGFTTQSRYILLDLPLIFFIVMATFSWVKFRAFHKKPFTRLWWIWLAATGISLGLATGSKLIGLFITTVVGMCTIRDLWDVTNIKKSKEIKTAVAHIGARVLCLIVIPFVVFLAAYWIHFKVLNGIGDGDKHMSVEFLHTLKGNNISNLTRPVYYEDVIKVRNKGEKSYLHSHKHLFPAAYPGGRNSSGRQQVTGYGHADENNDWVIFPAGIDASTIIYQDNFTWNPKIIVQNSTEGDQNNTEIEQNKTRVTPKHGDLIRLKHIVTNKYLIAEDIPTFSGMQQEVSSTDPLNLTDPRYAQTVWRLEMKGGQAELYSKIAPFRLINNFTGGILYTAKERLPDWGYKQQEIGTGILEDMRSWWSVDTISSLNKSSVQDEDTRLRAVEFLDKQAPSFFQKFVEYFSVQLDENSKLVEDGPPETRPWMWPILIHGQAFWGSKEKDGKIQKVYLLGNIFAWYIALLSVVIFIGLLVVDVVAQRRGLKFLNAQQQNFLYEKGGYFLLCYLLHYLPFFGMGRVLYFHHYLPCYLFSTMIFTSTYQILALKYDFLNSKLVIGAICLTIFYFWWLFACFSYGSPQTTEYIKSMKWYPRWGW